ncbi:MAG TPA: proline iminopeptidase-family hydrolase [Gaiellaceae bacterium]
MPAVDEGCVSFRGYETWYRRVRHGGSDGGVPLLCLHGGPGSTHRGLTTLEALADERDVVLYDQLGSGNSSQPSDPALWTVGLFVEEVAAVREALGLDRLHLLGHSWGGMLALEVALTRPAGLASLVLSSTLSSARLWAEESRRLRAALPDEIRAPLDAHEEAGTTDDPAYVEASYAFYRRHLCRLDPWPEVVDEIMRLTRLEVYNTMWGPSEMLPTGTLSGWDVTPRLGEIDVPTLVMCGRFDEATPLQAEVIAGGIAGAELVVFEESAHMTPIEEPERYLAVVRDFLRRVEALDP